MTTPLDPETSPMKMQVAFVTDDLEKSLQLFSDLTGLPVPAIGEQDAPEIAMARHRGEAAVIDFRQAAFVWRGTIIEFIEPGPTPSTWRDHLDRHGPSIHHLGFAVESIEKSREDLDARGFAVVQEGLFTGGGYTYHDAQKDLGCFIELLAVDRDVVRSAGLD